MFEAFGLTDRSAGSTICTTPLIGMSAFGVIVTLRIALSPPIMELYSKVAVNPLVMGVYMPA
jgi:hypothetical protein